MASVTIGILTRNSAAVLPRALKSVEGLGRIVVCDGYSQDATHEIAHASGAEVLMQDRKHLYEDGRVRDYSGVRNQILDATSGWVFFLDSDEYASPELVAELHAAAQGTPAAYWVPRLYVLKGEVIEHASTYPNRQMRYFHTDIAKRYVKEVHERIELLPNAPVRTCEAPIMTPLPETAREMRKKWRGYLAIEATRRTPISLRTWLLVALREIGIAGLLVWRIGANFFRRGRRMPLSYEALRLWYQWRLIKDSFVAVSRL